ncbi:MAG: hypothetical protein ABW123_14050 [Cystobacter sp.]
MPGLTDQQWKDASFYLTATSLYPNTHKAAEKNHVTEFIHLIGVVDEVEPTDSPSEKARKEKELEEQVVTFAGFAANIHFIQGYGTQLAGGLTHLVGTIKGVDKTVTAAFEKALHEMKMTFALGSPTQNAGGHVTLSNSVVAESLHAVKFALYHEIGHAVWAVARDARFHDIYRKLDPGSNPDHLGPGDMEYFADAIGAQLLKLDQVSQADAEKAAHALFGEEGEDKDHPKGELRVGRIKQNWAHYAT